jgi:glycine/D-amino acid oxidase-like deaminating enzyme
MAIAALGPRLAAKEVKARVVVVGGGIGGATTAKYLAASARTIEVTLVEPKPDYTTC